MARKKTRRLKKSSDASVSWLPIDSRLFGSFLSFGHVRGIARLFLIVELILSTLVVVGTLLLILIKK